jgi:retinol dehydrogenase 14
LGKIAKLFLISPEKGAETPVYLASSPEVEGASGKYYEQKRNKESSAESYDMASARRLWKESEKMTGLPISLGIAP